MKMSVGTNGIEKILKSEETEEQKPMPKPKPQHEPLHRETGQKKTEPKEAKEQRDMLMAEETMEHSGEKPKAQRELPHPPTNTGVGVPRSHSSRSNERFHHHTYDKFKEAALRRSKSTSDLNLEFNIKAKWCIYRVPSKLRNVNAAAYTPQLLSIGLFHYGAKSFEDMEEHKKRYSHNFCNRYWAKMSELSTTQKADELRKLINASKESIIHCYSGTIDLDVNKDQLVEVILHDACFIIELFLRNNDPEYHDKDYILSSPWLRKAVELELILFENQLPYSLLQDLYDHASPECSSSHPRKEAREHEFTIDIDKDKANPFLKLTCKFFKDFRKRNFRNVEKVKTVKAGVNPKHFTDLVRHFMCPDIEEEKVKTVKAGVNPKHFTDMVRHFICPDIEEEMCPDIEEEKRVDTENSRYSVRMLTAAGVDFVPAEDACFVVKIDDEVPKCMKLNIAWFRSMKLKLTPFCVKDDTECIIRNVMALEQFVYPDKAYVCNYFMMMDKLVDTVEDVDFLVEKKVIDNMLGSNEAVAQLLNKLCNHIMDEKSCYTDICKKLNTRYDSSINRRLVTLKRVYFKDIWTGSATFFGVVLVFLTMIEIFMSFKK